MMPKVPQLIAALDHLNQIGAQTSRALNDLLVPEDPAEAMHLGMNMGCPAHWWLAWQGAMERNAPCDELPVP